MPENISSAEPSAPAPLPHPEALPPTEAMHEGRFGLKAIRAALHSTFKYSRKRPQSESTVADEVAATTPEAWETAELNADLLAKTGRLLQTPEEDIHDPHKPRAKQILFAPHASVGRGVIDIVDSRDIDRIEAYVSIDDATFGSTMRKLAETHKATYDELRFSFKNGGDVFMNSMWYAAHVFDLGSGITVRMATGKTLGSEADEYTASSMENMIRIELDAEQHANSDRQLAYTLQTTLQEAGLGHLLEHSADDVEKFKARIAAEYRMVDPASITDTSELQIEEVDGSHISVTQPGLHEQYAAMADGIQVPTHNMSVENVVGVLKSTGLMSPLERYKRGLAGKNGRSPVMDIGSGGGDRVFMHNHSGRPQPYLARNGNMNTPELTFATSGKVELLYSSRLLDRVDAICLDGNAYGSATAGYGEHLRPEEFFTPGPKGDELDFNTHVANSYLMGLVCKSEDRPALLATLASESITQMNGVPIDLFVRDNASLQTWQELRRNYQESMTSRSALA